jgi:multidrug efflux pump subunit AcrA (membrane-fusion protein)
MQKDVIRVWVYVPQDAAFGVAPGVEAMVRVPELPNREFPGKVTRIADALQSGTRTLLTEIDIPNPDGALCRPASTARSSSRYRARPHPSSFRRKRSSSPAAVCKRL